MRRARTCYDHLAASLVSRSRTPMVERGYVVLDSDAGELTAEGSGFLDGLGADLSSAVRSRRAFLPAVSSTGVSGARILPAGSAPLSLILASSVTGSADGVWDGRVEITEEGIVAFKEMFGARI